MFAASESPAQLMVRVWTSLDGDASDESFGIDNVVITKLEEGYLEICLVWNDGVQLPFLYRVFTQSMPMHTHTYSQMQTCALPMHRRTQRF